jgi:hypothetical protein
MANPASLTITELTKNAAASLPTAQAIDTNGTVPIAAGSLVDRLLIEVVNTDDAALTVKVVGGTGDQAHNSADLSVALAATGGGATAQRMIGPFEAARFCKADGSIDVTFTAATGAPAANVRVYRLPRQI